VLQFPVKQPQGGGEEEKADGRADVAETSTAGAIGWRRHPASPLKRPPPSLTPAAAKPFLEYIYLTRGAGPAVRITDLSAMDTAGPTQENLCRRLRPPVGK